MKPDVASVNKGNRVEVSCISVQSGVLLALELGNHFLSQLLFEFCEFLIRCQVFYAIRIAFQIIEFFCRAFAEIQVPVIDQRTVAAAVEEQGLGWAAIAVEVAGLWIPGGPAIGFVVVNVNNIVLDDPPYRVAPVVRAPNIMPFFTE